jgi:hypothetical protein
LLDEAHTKFDIIEETMATPTLSVVPVEVLRQIVGYVHCAPKPSTISLALVNKLCHAVAIEFMLHSLTLHVQSEEHLVEQVQPPARVIENIRHLRVEGMVFLEYTRETKRV